MTTGTFEEEAAARLRRVETKVSRMCEAMGVSEGTTTPIRVDKNNPTNSDELHLQGYDVTLSALRRQLRNAGVLNTSASVALVIDGECVANIQFLSAK